MKICVTLSALALAAFSLSLSAQTPVLVADLNPGASGAFDEYNYKGIWLGNKYLLPADNGASGQELYVLEGGQLSLLKDINPGGGDSGPTAFAAFDNKVYFAANDGAHGAELWYTDGTADGTQLAVDVVPGSNGSNPVGLLTDASGSHLYFSSGGSCYALSAGSNTAVLLSGPTSVDFSDEFNFAGRRVCRFEDGIAFILLNSKNIEIWKAKGATATKLYTRLANSFYTQLYGLAPVSVGLLFGLYDSFDHSLDGLYAYDALAKTAARLSAPGADITRILPFTANKAIVLSSTGFYASDGTVAGTVILSGEKPQLYGGQALPHAVAGEKMIFWGSEGTFSITVKVTDGTPGGTSAANTTTEPFLSPIINYLEHAYYAVGVSNGFTPQIWRTNLNTGVSTKLFTYNNSSTSGPSILPLALIGNNLYFVSNLGGAGRELYRITVSQNTGVSETARASVPYVLQYAGVPGTYRIELPEQSAPETLSLRLFNLGGQMLQQMEVSSGSEFLLEAPNGLYLLEATGKMGTAAFKVVR